MQELLPKGLKLLKGPKRSYAFMVAEMNKCCEEYPNCKYRGECQKLFSDYHFADPYKERKLEKEGIGKEPKRQTDEEKYSNWMPILHSRDIRQTVQANSVY